MGLIYCDWAQDIPRDANGKIIKANAFDSVRQNITRELLTNPAEQLNNGQFTPADYKWHPDFGLGLPRFLGQLYDDNVLRAMQQKCLQSVKTNPNVANSPVPTVVFVPLSPASLQIYIDYILKLGTSQSFAVEVSD